MTNVGDDLFTPVLREPVTPAGPPSRVPSTPRMTLRRLRLQEINKTSEAQRPSLATTQTSLNSVVTSSRQFASDFIEGMTERALLTKQLEREEAEVAGDTPFGSLTRSQFDGLLADRDAEKQGMARYRQECSRSCQDRCRRQAATWREKHERQEQGSALHWYVQDPFVNCMFSQGERNVPTPVFDEGQEARDKNWVEAGSFDGPGSRRPLRESTLRPKRPMKDRLKALRHCAKLRHKRKEVEEQLMEPMHHRDVLEVQPKVSFLPNCVRRRRLEEERESVVLRSAFSKHDEDNSDSLDQSELLQALVDLGLSWHTKTERIEVRNVLWDMDKLQIDFAEFASSVVPKVRKTLHELRKPRLLELFHEVDDRRGLLSIEEAVGIARRVGIFVNDEVCFNTMYAYEQEAQRDISSVSQSKRVLDEDGFVQFMCLLQERVERYNLEQASRIATEFNLTAEEQQAVKHELVDFHKMFYEWDPCSGRFGSPSGVLSEEQVVTVIRESGYMPKVRPVQVVQLVIQRVKSPSGTLRFKQFLQVMTRLKELDQERLRKVFSLQADSTFGNPGGVVPVSALGRLLRDCGIQAMTTDDKAEVRRRVEDCDDEGSGLLTACKFVELAQRVASQLRAMQRERERLYVLAAGWTEQHFNEFRAAFQVFDEDMSGVLEHDELLKAVDLLKGQYWQSSQNMNLMFVALGIDPNKEIKVNFLMFLRMLKMLDDSESRRQMGAIVGYGRDRTDKLFSAFQALDPESSNTMRRSLLERVIAQVCSRLLGKSQLAEALHILEMEPSRVEFSGFLRVVKSIENQLDSELEELIDALLAWEPNDVKTADGAVDGSGSPWAPAVAANTGSGNGAGSNGGALA